MSGIVNLLWFVLILGAIVIVHEFGHLLAAKKFGVYCKEFSIGMGPLLWQKQKGETAWSIRALPIGGFVAMAGEDEESDELFGDLGDEGEEDIFDSDLTDDNLDDENDII